MKRLLLLMVLATAAILGGVSHWSAAQVPPGAPAPSAPGPNPRYYAVQQKLDPGGSFYLYCDLKDQLKQFMTMLRPYLIKPGMPSNALGIHAMADRVLDRLGLYGIHDLGVSSISEGEFNRTKCYVSAPEGRQRGILGVLGGAPHPLALLDRASSTTLIAALGDFDLPAAWALVRQIAMDIGGINATMAIDKGVVQIKQQSGLDLEAIVNSLGGEFAVFLDQDPASKLSIPLGPANPLTFDSPRLALLVRVKDATLYDSLKNVLQLRQTPLKPETVKGNLKMVQFDLPPNPVWEVSPTLGCDGEYLYLASHAEMVRQLTGPAKNPLRWTAEYQKLTAGLPTEGNGATYVSPRLGALVRDGLDQILAANPLFQNGKGELFVDLIQKQAGAASVRVNEANGVLSISRSKGGGLLYMGEMLALPAGALAAIAGKQFANRGAQAKQTAAKVQIATIGTALNAFEVDMGRYPTTAEGLNALVKAPGQAPGWRGPYLKNAIVNDPWGNPYIYECPGRNNTKGYDLISTGPDGQRGTEDDVANWNPNK